jgi:Arf-GAP/Rho-GAP domain/ANK repeat/PH domain-containing protein 1
MSVYTVALHSPSFPLTDWLCRKRSQRPWQKRWTVFSGEELKYFNDKNSKESDALNHVRLRDMIDVKKINDANSSEKQHRFDLVVIGRVFQFYSDSREDCDNWVAVLHAAIARFQPEENKTMKEGGNLHDPEKQGVLLKQGRGMRQSFRERYVALKGSKFAYYENKEAFVHARPIHILELALANVRPDPSGKHRFIITMNNQKTYTFQAANDMERHGWLDAITEAILRGLVDGEKAASPPTKKETAVQEIMPQIQENHANRVCADCLSVDPSWGVVNLGIMVCIECSGVHRSMGILVSKVRSLELDRSIWTSSLIQVSPIHYKTEKIMQ